MSLATQVIADRNAVLLNTADGFVCSVQNLTNQTFVPKAICFGTDVNADSKAGLSNVIKSTLWIPVEITSFAQEDKLLITFSDDTTEEFTVSAAGGRFGGFRKVEVVQTRVTRMRQSVSVAPHSPYQPGLSQLAEPEA